MSDVTTYTNLVTSQHRDKPRFIKTIEAVASPLVYIQNILNAADVEYDLDTARGKQLDVIGEWVGLSRNVRTPIDGIFFSWDDTAALGWEGGIWKDEFTPPTGITVLPDDAYRVLIRGKIAANHWDGTIPGAYAIWEAVFPNSFIIIQDNQNMSMIVGIAGEPLDTLTKVLLTQGYLPLKPEGVRVEFYAVVPEAGPIFAWDTETGSGVAMAGWDSGLWSEILIPV